MADVIIEVPVVSSEEADLLGEVVNRVTDGAGSAKSHQGCVIVKTEVQGAGLVKRIIFEERRTAAEFRTQWRRARCRLAAATH